MIGQLRIGRTKFGVGLSTTIILSACEPTPPSLPGESPIPCDPERRVFVVDELSTDGATAGTNPGFDLDGDGEADARGSFMRDALDEADILSNAFADALSTGAVTWVLVMDQCPDVNEVRINFHEGRLEVAPPPDVPTVSLVAAGIPAVGKVEDSGTITVATGRGSVPLSALFDSRAATEDQIWMPGESVSFEVDTATSTELHGSIGFGFHVDAFIEGTHDAIARTLTDVILADPGCPLDCAPGPSRYYQDRYDANTDGTVTGAELLQVDPLINSQADVDLFANYEGRMVFWPGHDGSPESLSFGAEFHARRATLED